MGTKAILEIASYNTPESTVVVKQAHFIRSGIVKRSQAKMKERLSVKKE